ncbi:glycosyltransferase [Allokutzneria sp. NRRL B-24872]|uniref:glycosyltransferase n=1 Tax=Allokutzneria sp. NRRL B-24872 TaxID=1137961 RepID=UPI000A3873A8|nr:glycosyltransferase [Allokutzneria sp. NRRL B-24872]
MKIVITAVGVRGDVVPFTGLGRRLAEVGHEVAVATAEAHEPLVRAAGLDFLHLRGADSSHSAWEETGAGAALAGARQYVELMRQLCDGVLTVAEDADLLLLHHLTIPQGYAVGKALGIPTMALELFPTAMAPTGDFPPAEASLPNLGRWANRNLDGVLRTLTAPTVRFFADFQARLGLPAVGLNAMLRAMHQENYPVHHGFSRQVVPRPSDWRPGLEISGYWWPAVREDWTPSAELTDFLASGPPPVFVSFGSMAAGDGDRLSEITAAALRRAGVRGIVQAGWAGLAVADNDDVLTIGEAPHEWLFPQMAAVVHHGGAGTTGAALRAGVPAVPTPLTADQPFWAARLKKLGVSPGSVPLRKLTAERLGELVHRAAHEPSLSAVADAVGEQIRSEDGAGQIVKAVELLA